MVQEASEWYSKVCAPGGAGWIVGSAGGDGGRGKHPLLQTRTPAAGAPPSVEGQAQLHCMPWPTVFVSLRYTSSPPLTESGMQVPSAGRVPFGIPGGG